MSPLRTTALARRLGRRAAELGAVASSPAAVAQALLDVLLDEVPSAGGALMLMHPQTTLFWTGAVTALPAASCRPFFGVEVEASSPYCFRRMALTGSPAVAVSLHAAPDDPIRRDVLAPHGFSDDLRAVCRDAGTAWGGVSLWRRDGTFTRQEEALVTAVCDELGAALRTAVLESLGQSATAPAVHGVVVLDGERVVESSAEVEGILRSISEPDFEEYRHLDHLLALAASGPRFSTVMGTDDGQWLSAHGSALGSGKVAIVLTTATPADLLGTRVAGANLTAREVEVTRLLCRGLSDAEIATELHISAHTAHDHVRAVRRKLGVRNRSEVAALVFADHYVDGFLQSAAIRHSDDNPAGGHPT